MKHEKKFFFATYLIIVTSVLAGCSSDGPEIEQPEKVYYDLAQRRIESKNYIAAIESLQAIETRYPFGRYAEQAQVELIYVYFMNNNRF